MNKSEIIIEIQNYLKNKEVKKASLFGSFINDDISYNDIDILLELSKGKSLIDLVGIKLELEELLNKKVNVLTYNSMHPAIRNEVLENAKLIYEQR